ncbi:unnamed protein product [Ilex paraguariensis]|uniref:Uncharacterized protein n=1 Tax=Ilex paraguariensis TaxID=185542 RepID=A0ABC8U8M5_9AQUA
MLMCPSLGRDNNFNPNCRLDASCILCGHVVNTVIAAYFVVMATHGSMPSDLNPIHGFEFQYFFFGPTYEFPHPLARVPQSAGYWLSYILVDLLIWWGIRGYINDFRKKKLKLPSIAYFSMFNGSISHFPTGYMWSPHVVPKPNGEDCLFLRGGGIYSCTDNGI